MDAGQIKKSISCCGLVCILCDTYGACDCREDNHCGKRLSPEGCYQYDCCTKKGLNGCWECGEAPCGEDMFSKNKIKLRAFITCIKEDGPDMYSRYISKNAENGIVYHRNGIYGDYDLETEGAVLQLLRTGKPG
jgi:hypothetical protein